MFKYTEVRACKNRRSFFVSLIARSWFFFATTDGRIINFQPVSSKAEGCLCDTPSLFVRIQPFCKFKNYPESSIFLQVLNSHHDFFHPLRSIQSILAVQSVSPSLNPLWKIRDFSCKRVTVTVTVTVIYVPSSFVARTTKINLHSPFRIHTVSVVLFTSGLHTKLWQIPLFNFALFLFQLRTPHGWSHIIPPLSA